MTDIAALLKGRRDATLAEIGPQPGEKIRLEVRSPHQRLMVQLLGLKEFQSVMVSAPRQQGTVLMEGVRFTARLMSGNYLCTFETRLLQSQSRPFAYWHLEYPDRVEMHRIRAHTRVPIILSVRVEHDEPGMLVSNGSQSAICRDISLQGAQLECSQPLAQPGESLFVTARVQVAGIDHLLLLPAVVRNVQQLESGLISAFTHGVEFVDLEEETRLVLAGFVYEQQLISLGELEGVES
ncbi:flagellar brake protein [Marinobacterium sediminicola]|uniref:Protein YcgR n=1 Tax=Marinobacterium sediminicola TaxID=518898 RepID=A0ABY1RYX5_9GAMM|nr:PilZ domain-containing protein [Marinobacterium sediminicola]ULG67975.1 flagellar brake protein [Marinobacterium sediminicola]SMR73517.1 protein YcgR [Marinobacterium sediminicola]